MTGSTAATVRVLVALLVVGAAGVPLAATAMTGSAQAQASGVNLSITDVSVEPTRPVDGERATVTTTIRNSAGSSEAVRITDVAIRTAPDREFEELTRIEDLGSLSPGNELSVPLSTTFSGTGHGVYRVHVWGENESGGNVHVQYPLTVQLRSEERSVGTYLSFSGRPAVTGVEETVNFTVVNSLDGPIENVEIAASSERLDVVDGTAVDARIPAGTKREYDFDVVAPTAGTRAVTAEIRYLAPDGGTVTKRRSLEVSVEPLVERVDLSASPTDDDAVRVEVANLGRAPMRDVSVRVSAPSGWSDVDLLDDVPAHEASTVSVDASTVPNATTLDVELSYEMAGESREASTSVEMADDADVPARIELTGVDLEREDGKLHVSGSASNLGETAASSVVVGVVAGDSVEPAFPGREYFVGTVPASDFAAFDVYAHVDDDATEIPLSVSYLDDGERTRRTVTVPYELDSGSGLDADAGASGSGPLSLVVAGVVVVGVGAIVGVALRNYRARN